MMLEFGLSLSPYLVTQFRNVSICGWKNVLGVHVVFPSSVEKHRNAEVASTMRIAVRIVPPADFMGITAVHNLPPSGSLGVVWIIEFLEHEPCQVIEQTVS